MTISVLASAKQYDECNDGILIHCCMKKFSTGFTCLALCCYRVLPFNNAIYFVEVKYLFNHKMQEPRNRKIKKKKKWWDKKPVDLSRHVLLQSQK